MSEELTQNLDGGESFESRVMAGLAAINNRLASFEGHVNTRLTSLEGHIISLENRVSSLEGRFALYDERLNVFERRLNALGEKVDARLHETRPIWEAVLSRLDVIESKVEALALNLLDMRGDLERVKKRIPPAA
jgi:chromosome segregation ATPase